MAAEYESKAPVTVPTKPPEKTFYKKREYNEKKREEDRALIFGLKVQNQTK